MSEEVRGGWGGIRPKRTGRERTPEEQRPTMEPDAGRLGAPAAALAALAESGIVFLVVRLVCVEQLGVTVGPLASFPMFALLFTGSTAVATRFHRSVLMPPLLTVGAAAVGLTQGGAFGHGGVGAISVAIVLSLGAALRVVTLAIRDWRNPVDTSFGWGAALLLIEVLVASSTRAGWQGVLPVIVPVFFIASLVSRALSVRVEAEQSGDAMITTHEGGATVISPPVPPGKMPIVLTAAAAGGIVVIAVLGIKGGVFERVGSVVLPAAVWVIVAASLVLGLFGTVIAVVLSKFHIDLLGGIQRLAGNLGRGRPRITNSSPGAHTWLDRLIGLVVLVGIVYLVVRLLNRRREFALWRPRRRLGTTEVRALGELPAPTVRVTAGRGRRALPRDAVRRWYAQTLMLLESRGLRKPVWATPAEYVGIVGEAFPESRPGFESLTRAYEQVRYAARDLDRRAVQLARRDRDAVTAVIRRARRADLPGEGDREEVEAAAAGGGLGPGPRGALGGAAGPMAGEEGEL